MERGYKTGLMRYMMSILLVLLAVIAVAAPEKKKLLVINSYDEAESWANDLATPIAMYLAGIDSVGGHIVNLDNALITDSVSYNHMVNSVFMQHEESHPDYVVLLGNFAFTLRDRIKAEWGDIPMLLVSRLNNFGTLEDNFCKYDEMLYEQQGTPLETVRNQYNFTAIILPDHSEECVDLMLRLNPDMEELVLLTTGTYISRHVAGEVYNHIQANYPNIKFTWLRSSEQNAARFQDYMANRSPEKGFLLTSWVYERKDSRGFRTLTSNDIRLLSSSKNPIFSVRESYIDMGCIGGVYVDREAVKAHLIDVVHKMLAGKSMHEIPFTRYNEGRPCLNYRLIKEYGIDEKLCPDNTVYRYKPATYWEKYLWQTITTLLLFAIFVAVVWWKIYSQNARLARMKYDGMFLNNMPVPFAKAEIRYDQQGKVRNIVYTKHNDAFESLITHNAAPDNPFLLFPADFISEKTEQLLRTGQNVSFTYHFDKTDTWYNFTLCFVLLNKVDRNEIQTVVDIFANDITDRLRLETRLRLAARKLQLALQVSGTVPWQWDLRTDIVTFDDMGRLGRTTSRKITTPGGQEEWQIAYNDFILRIHPEDRHLLIEQATGFHSGAITENQMQMRMYKEPHSEETDWIQIYSAVTDNDAAGDSLTITGTLQIITEQKQAEEDMAAAKQRAEESDRMKSTFLANMSHEIRTPLNAIVGFSNLITEAETPEEQQEFKQIINGNTDLLLTLINDVLDLAKIESNTIDINFTVADINAIIQSVEQSTKLRLNPGVRLNSVLGLDRCVVETDPVRLSQVLINLLTNACKFTSHGSITFGYERHGDSTLRFYVSDTGIGISPEGQKKIFERFVKLNNFAQGTGLGLSICKRLVEMLGGEIGVTSEGEGCGSRFWFTLPYVPIADENAHEGIDHPHLIAAEDTVRPAKVVIPEDDKPIVLVAEDHESNYKLIVHLMKERYHLIRAINGKEAIDMYLKYKPSLILMDINMPVMNGYEAVEIIRKNDQDVPIVAVTAYAYASDRIKIMNSGFDGYISKPVSQKALKDVLHNIQHGGGKKKV